MTTAPAPDHIPSLAVSEARLVTAIDHDDATIVVDDGSAMPLANFLVMMGDEIISVTSRSSNTLTVAARGYINSEAWSHAVGTSVFFSAWDGRIETHVIDVGDEGTAQTAAVLKAARRWPYAFNVTGVRISVSTAPTDAAFIVDINSDAVTMLSTKLTIDATEKTSETAAVPAVISVPAIIADAEVTIDIDQIGSTVAGTGLKVQIDGYRTA